MWGDIGCWRAPARPRQKRDAQRQLPGQGTEWPNRGSGTQQKSQVCPADTMVPKRDWIQWRHREQGTEGQGLQMQDGPTPNFSGRRI